METISIQPLATDDLTDAADLLTQLNPETPAAIIGERLRTLLADHSHYQLFGAFSGGQLAGVAGAWIATKIWCGRYLEIDNLVVASGQRSAGIGSLLIRHLEDTRHGSGIARSSCSTATPPTIRRTASITASGSKSGAFISSNPSATGRAANPVKQRLSHTAMRVAIVHYHLAPGGVTRVIESASQVLTSRRRPPRHPHRRHRRRWQGRPAPDRARNVPSGSPRSSTSPPSATSPPHRHHSRRTPGQPPRRRHPGPRRHHPTSGISTITRSGKTTFSRTRRPPRRRRRAPRPADPRPRRSRPPRELSAHRRPPRALSVFPAHPLRLPQFPRPPALHRRRTPPGNATLLPNPIPLPSASLGLASAATSPTILFAPIRGIRRKNLGELVFYPRSLLPRTWFAVSRAPLNPDALPVHDHWRKFAGQPSAAHRVRRRRPPRPSRRSHHQLRLMGHARHPLRHHLRRRGLRHCPFSKPSPTASRSRQKPPPPHCGSRPPRHPRRTPLRPPPHPCRAGSTSRSSATTSPSIWSGTYRCYRRPLTDETIETTLARHQSRRLARFRQSSRTAPAGHHRAVPARIPPTAPFRSSKSTASTHPAADWLAATIADRRPTATPAQLAPYSLENYQDTLTTLYQKLSGQPAAPVSHLPPDRILDRHLTPGGFHFLLSALKPAPPRLSAVRAVVFDIYGTLLIAPPGGVRPDPFADPVLREILRGFGHAPPASPSGELHAAVLRHHAAAGVEFPEIDLRVLWREILGLPPGTDTTALVEALEAAWHPARPMPGAEQIIGTLAGSGHLARPALQRPVQHPRHPRRHLRSFRSRS